MNSLPATIGPYTCVRDVIGSGAFALVIKGYLTSDPSLQVAIKAVAKKNLCKRNSNLLEKERKILKELTTLKHQNLVALLHCEESVNHVFLVMEYCNAGDLADYLQLKKKLMENDIRLFLRQIAQALKVIHSCGIVHRDLKPQNILMSISDGENTLNAENYILKIGDFGFARFLQSGVMAVTLCGSPMYMAPEVLMSLQYDDKADLWSVGTIVYQCLVGCAPFQARSPTVLRQYYERNKDLNPRIPMSASVEFTNLTRRLLCKNPSRRLSLDELLSHQFLTAESQNESKSSYKTSLIPINCAKTLQDADLNTFEIIDRDQCLMEDGASMPQKDVIPQFVECPDNLSKKHTYPGCSSNDYVIKSYMTSQLPWEQSAPRDEMSILKSFDLCRPDFLRQEDYKKLKYDCHQKQSFSKDTSNMMTSSCNQQIYRGSTTSVCMSESIGYLFGLISKSFNPLLPLFEKSDITMVYSLSIKCLDLIADTVDFIQSENLNCRLKATSQLVAYMELFLSRYNQCIEIVDRMVRAPSIANKFDLPDCDQIITNHALGLCMSSICDEYFDQNIQRCVLGYRESYVLFHLLSQTRNTKSRAFENLRDQVGIRLSHLEFACSSR